jgi:hypothetical protein
MNIKYPKVLLKHSCIKRITTEHRQVLEAMVALKKAATVDVWVETVFNISKTLFWEGIDPEEHLSFRGDALELITEYLMNVNSLANNQGVLNYKPVPLRDDFGVDATGVKNGVDIVIQCKFKHNPEMTIRYSDLARTFCHGVKKYNLDPKQNKNLWLVTTGKDANINSYKVLGDSLHVIHRKHLSKQVDGNVDFWNGLLTSFDFSLKHKK